MAQPARKAGGLYGGIQFSSSTSFAPSVSESSTHVDEKPSTTTNEPPAPIPSTSAAEPLPQAQESEAGKPTAGIRLLSEPI